MPWGWKTAASCASPGESKPRNRDARDATIDEFLACSIGNLLFLEHATTGLIDHGGMATPFRVT